MSADSTKPPAGSGPPAPLTPQDAMAFMQRMWNPFGLAWPGMPTANAPGSNASGAANAPPAPAPDPGFAAMPFPNPAMMFAALDPAEIERKIAELRIVEGWLAMSLNLMQMSVRTLELQKASLEALRGPPHGTSGRPPKG